MIFTNIFTNFIVHDYLQDIDNFALENYCKKEFVQLSESQDYASTYLNEDAFEVKNLISVIGQKVNEVKNIVGIDSTCELQIDRVWCNINNNKNIDLPHSHPLSLFSVVYYVKANPNSGDLVFITPNSAHQNNEIGKGLIVSNFNEFTSATWSVAPEASKMIIFPSWLTHYVQQNKSEQERISIAMDFYVKK